MSEAFTELPWRHGIVETPLGPTVIVEGDAVNLDRMFTDLPDFHRRASHSTIKSINDELQGNHHYGDEDEDEVEVEDWSFFQAKSYEEVRNHITVVGKDSITKLVTKHLADPEMRDIIHMSGKLASRPRAVYGDEGDEVDMDRMFGGEEDMAWRRIERLETRRRSRSVIIDVNVIMPGGMNHKDYTWNGVQAAVIIDALEAEGYRVEVNLLQCLSMWDNHRFCSRVRVKRADEPLRLDLLAYQTGCVAVTRAAMWRLIHVHEGSISGYGTNNVDESQVRVIAHAAASEGRKPDHILAVVDDRASAIASIQRVIGQYRAQDDIQHAS